MAGFWGSGGRRLASYIAGRLKDDHAHRTDGGTERCAQLVRLMASRLPCYVLSHHGNSELTLRWAVSTVTTAGPGKPTWIDDIVSASTIITVRRYRTTEIRVSPSTGRDLHTERHGQATVGNIE
jgi:hypothetical protein